MASSSSVLASGGAEPLVQSRRSLYVGGLAETVTEITLRAAMIPFGPIKSIEIPMDYAKGYHKGFAFVEYQDGEDAAEAIYNLDGADLLGRVLTVSLAQPNQMKLGSSHKAVWSTDEWFKEQQQQDEGEGSDKAKDEENKAMEAPSASKKTASISIQ